MRIDSFQYLNQCRTKPYQANANTGKVKTPGKRNCDTVSFSSMIPQKHEMVQQKNEVSDTQLLESRAERVEQIKQQINAGTYSVSGRAVVEKMCYVSGNIGHKVNENG